MTSRICYDWRQIRAFHWKTSQKSPKIDKGDWWLFFCVQTGYPQSMGVSNLFDHSYLHVTGDGKPTRRRRNKQDGTVVERRNVVDRSKIARRFGDSSIFGCFLWWRCDGFSSWRALHFASQSFGAEVCPFPCFLVFVAHQSLVKHLAPVFCPLFKPSSAVFALECDQHNLQVKRTAVC